MNQFPIRQRPSSHADDYCARRCVTLSSPAVCSPAKERRALFSSGLAEPACSGVALRQRTPSLPPISKAKAMSDDRVIVALTVLLLFAAIYASNGSW